MGWVDEASEGQEVMVSGDLGSKLQIVWRVTGKEHRFWNRLSGLEFCALFPHW